MIAAMSGNFGAADCGGRLAAPASAFLNGATTMEAVGAFGGFSTMGEYFNVQTKTLDLRIRWAYLSAVFAVEKTGHLDNRSTKSI